MKTDHKMYLTQIRYRKSLFVFICPLVACTLFSGCGTAHFMREGFGKSAEIKFEVLHPEMPNPMIHWIAYPDPSETVLTLNPQLPDCEKVRFFVNPTRSDPHELSDKLEKVELIKLRNEKDKQDLWNLVPTGNCSVLLTVGYSDIVGLSASTRSGVFSKHEISFQKDKEGNPGALILAVFSPFYDAMYSPLYLTIAVANAVVANPDDVTVVIEFPDDRRMETKLTYDEASHILKGHFFGSDSIEFGFMSSRLANFWLHAALIKLRLDFKIQGLQKNMDSPVMNLYIQSIDKSEGSWCFQVDNTKVECNLTENAGIKPESVIRLFGGHK